MIEQTLQAIAKKELFLIAGPCVIESEQLCCSIAGTLSQLSEEYNIPLIFKASYKKANRLSADSFSGPGLVDGLKILKKIKSDYKLPILTDIHETSEISAVAEVADILQIPAFLCRQTELVKQAGETGKYVNIKKGQFLAPEDMGKLATKANTDKVLLTERGTSFGYRNLVVDFRSLVIMKKTGYPVIYDVTHSLQLPGGGGNVTTGQPEFILPMTRAAAAVGIDGLFVETHPDPKSALSDAGSMLPLSSMRELIEILLTVRKVVS